MRATFFMMLALGLALLIGQGRLKSAELEKPQNLTMTALPDKAWQLTWDPILDDRLMGFVVFSRRGKAEFTRINKVPLSAALFKFKGLDAARPVEMVVTAEYEDGRSSPSAPVFSVLARQLTSLTPTVETTPAAEKASEDSTLASDVKKAKTPKPTPAPTPFDQRPLRQRISLLAPYQQWRVQLMLDGQMIRTITKGTDKIEDMPAVPMDWYNYSLTQKYSWEYYLLRSVIRVPLTLRYGMFPGLDAGLTVPFQSEYAKVDRLIINGKDYPDTRYAGSTFPEFSTSGLGDIEAFSRLEIISEPPLILGVKLAFPTGVSRFKSYLDYIYFDKLAAGNGKGVTQFTLSALYGPKGLRRGLHVEGSYSPGGEEDVKLVDTAGEAHKHQAVYGDEWTAGCGFTLPWEEDKSSAVLGLLLHGIKAGKWIYDDRNVSNVYDRQVMQAYIRNQSGLNLYDDNQLEAYLEVNQDLGLTTVTGKLQFINRADGYTLGISGGLIY